MANDIWKHGTLLIAGGAGKTGKRVAERLTRQGRNVRLASRSTDPTFDWVQPQTWGTALKGVSAVYIAYQPDLAVPGAVETVSDFFRRATENGVEKLVLLSGRGEPEAEEAEQALRATSAEWTILRSSWFSQNFSENYLLDAIVEGEVALPQGLAAEPFVDVEDIAEIATAAFMDSRHSRQLYDITGPDALTFEDAIAAIAAATGRTISFALIPPAEYRAELMRQNLPQDVVELVMYLFTTVLDGRNTPLGDGVRSALGRAPSSFADYVARTAATGVWRAQNA
jgi:uncharacterized protein YbjT (DUF2867 family)